MHEIMNLCEQMAGGDKVQATKDVYDLMDIVMSEHGIRVTRNAPTIH